MVGKCKVTSHDALSVYFIWKSVYEKEKFPVRSSIIRVIEGLAGLFFLHKKIRGYGTD